MDKLPEYILDRTFDAPRDLVWRAWTEPEILSRWYGPGAETIIHEFNLSADGLWLNEMRWGEKSHYQKVIFKEVSEPGKLVWHHHSSTDSEWNDAANPMMPDWPAILLTTVTFQENNTKTNVRLKWVPFEASEAEIACFTGAMDGMNKGWGSGFAVLDELLQELQ
jgi:uncharacterized protein YndB with AHSA1/START domain